MARSTSPGTHKPLTDSTTSASVVATTSSPTPTMIAVSTLVLHTHIPIPPISFTLTSPNRL